MKINSSRIQRVETWYRVEVTEKGKIIPFNVVVVDGKVIGDHKRLSTPYIPYLQHTSDKLKQKHFEQIKAHVETVIKLIKK